MDEKPDTIDPEDLRRELDELEQLAAYVGDRDELAAGLVHAVERLRRRFFGRSIALGPG